MFLPIVVPGPVPVYSFNATVEDGQTIFIDPLVAIGYEYAIGPGDPNFASVILPTDIGDNLYNLYVIKKNKYLFKARLQGGVPYYFDRHGVDRFLILGIEKEAELDPNNTTAFITGLTFTESGNFTGTMTPITESDKAKVTGGGWMLSEADAYKVNPALEGKAIFGFIAKYTKGTPVPEGVTEFIFGRGHLRFHSNKYQYLTVDQTGTNVQFKGTGSINGKGDYSFMVWADDISKRWGEDTFRIKIWETTTGETVYDNEMNQEINGGSIRIYTK